MNYKIVLAIAATTLGGLAACSNTQPTPEVEYCRAVDVQNWTLCESLYKEAGRYTLHIGHTHRYNGKVDGVTPHRAVKDDLADNHCRTILKTYWAECPY